MSASFDEHKLVSVLNQLPTQLAVAFAAACAERQLGNYIQFNAVTGEGDPASVRAAIDCIWDDLMGKTATDETFKRHLDNCMSLVPEDEGGTTALHAVANDAVASVAFAIRTRLTGDTKEAVWAARRAYESLDHEIVRRLNTNVITPNIENRVLTHPLIQAELRRQERDLRELSSLERSSLDLKSVIGELRSRAQRDAAVFFISEPADRNDSAL